MVPWGEGERIVQLLKKFFGLRTATTDDADASKKIAKERLKLALTYDRGGLPRGAIEQLRDELILVIAKHLAIATEDVQINFERTSDYDKLIASIPLTVQRAPVQAVATPDTPAAEPKRTHGRRRRR
jgi:cell division topological specificity factor MinE